MQTDLLTASAATLALSALIALAGQLPQGGEPTRGLLRLSWSTVGEPLRVPRAVDENVPAHMRLPEAEAAFEEQLRAYDLLLTVDRQVVVQRTCLGGGWRHDRPLSVFVELPVEPGKHEVEVDFAPRPAEGARWRPHWRGSLEVGPGEVHVLHLDAENQFQWLSKTDKP